MSSRKILAVLDASHGSKSPTVILEDFGDSVTVVHSFPEAKEILRSRCVDLISLNCF
ncbi:MAG: hypothetical protein SGI71_04585 [Verrucomicrobiota bacterium]|nr:hypothetical protein [Verrucomicrobiota bacterium]